MFVWVCAVEASVQSSTTAWRLVSLNVANLVFQELAFLYICLTPYASVCERIVLHLSFTYVSSWPSHMTLQIYVPPFLSSSCAFISLIRVALVTRLASSWCHSKQFCLRLFQSSRIFTWWLLHAALSLSSSSSLLSLRFVFCSLLIKMSSASLGQRRQRLVADSGVSVAQIQEQLEAWMASQRTRDVSLDFKDIGPTRSFQIWPKRTWYAHWKL